MLRVMIVGRVSELVGELAPCTGLADTIVAVRNFTSHLYQNVPDLSNMWKHLEYAQIIRM